MLKAPINKDFGAFTYSIEGGKGRVFTYSRDIHALTYSIHAIVMNTRVKEKEAGETKD